MGLDRALSWRKKELIAIYLDSIPVKSIGSTRSDGHSSHLMRAAVLLMYAHWEGFAKSAFSLYYNEILAVNANPVDLNNGLLGIATQKSLRRTVFERSPINTGRAISSAITGYSPFSMPPASEVVKTKSNLTAKRLREILARLGLDRDAFQQWENTTIKPLVDQRNAIAHGAGLEIDTERYVALHHSVLDLFDRVNEVINIAIVARSHLRAIN